ncbi:AAA family ATPase [Cytophaga hutchinsonii]|jgi:MoxR-like ATPase|uniref:MoxR-like ATPase, possible regulator n=1 Tax=Cytophaga hutchinsonii (strain ATCC 33406 / DSM 1761 / CIP 103989 / NBRC 15051 / NCIMB 9469 / D465) TaxID=269798 RepID=A0A6N4SSJ6_CYTH3|nr:MoxR family ATPase [Cytophaga hutchinsonii]ABG59399.1 MoxR-like ATPase, possible regulator [Cytophaga hutchinsonii ATCC 33406]SFX92997.1 MoxR-like ATPase [Cytophaga hutchinsonii ATCC 33406]
MEDTFSITPDDSYSRLNNMVLRVKNEIHKVIIGQDEMIDLMLAGIFSGGHVLLEGVPGIAKTVTAKTLAKTLDVHFNRIQFTPDLMPTDVVGTTIFNVKTAEFQFNKGPIFSNIVLIDEINRSPAKTQAALFEVMEEKQITVDGVTHPLQFPFFVIATQNPIEQEGTYKLPEAQLDRFIFKIKLSYPTLEEEKRILRRFKEDFTNKVSQEVSSVLSYQDLTFIAEHIEKIHIEEHLLDYIGQIVFNTRNHPDLYLGASPRASLSILKTSKAIAAMRGRNFVIPEDIQYVAYPVLNHRIILTPEKEMEGDSTESVIKSIIEKIEVPR